jgi:L-threonylcarbamoyladenylate synthase
MRDWSLRQIRRIVDRQHGLIAYPTESVYGLGCHPLAEDAVMRLLRLKNRDWEKGLILVASNLQQIESYVLPISIKDRQRLHAESATPTTWLLPAHADTPPWLTGNNTALAIRVSSHPTIVAMCDYLQHPIVSTSANPSGLPPARTALQVQRYFPTQLDLIIHSREACRGRPSLIRDLISNKVVRA